MKKEIRKCIVCGKKFTPKSHNTKVCSDKCRKAHKSDNKKDNRKKANVAKKVAKISKQFDKAVAKTPAKIAKAVKKNAVCVQKVTLPAKPTKAKIVKVEHRPTVIVNKGDYVVFKGFDRQHIIGFALELLAQAALKGGK